MLGRHAFRKLDGCYAVELKIATLRSAGYEPNTDHAWANVIF